MKIKQFFKKAAATVMAAVTVLSLLPTTAFAATGDVGTISFTRTYDSAGNAMYYNSSAVINGYTAGGTGKNKYRMYVDGSTAFCIQPGVPLKTGNQLTENSSETWNALSASQKKAVGLALLYGYQGNRDGLTGSDDEKWLATQTLVWEFVTGCRNSTGSFAQTDTTVYSLHFGSNYPNSGARAAYDQIVSMLTKHNTVPSFMNGSTRDLEYKDGQYVLTLTDTNGVLSEYSFSSSDRNVSVSKSGNTLTISSANAFSGSVRITATRNNIPVVSESAKLIAYGDPNLQDLVTGVENTDGVSAYLNVETPTGTIGLKKTSEDGKVEGITFTVEGNGIQQTVKTNAAGEILIDGLTPGVYTVTEQSYEKYEPQSVQRVTVIGGRTSTVTFNNVLKRGDLTVTKTSEDGLVEGMKFHLYGTSLSGIAVDEYAVTDSSGKAYFKDVLIGSGYVLEEVDTPIRYVVPESQTAAVEWNTVTEKSVSNVLKKWNATVTKSDRETGTAQGNAYLAGATYGIYKGDQLVDTYTTDANGQFITAYYVCDDDWSIREISPSEGYLLDETSYHVGAEPQLYTVEYNSAANDVNEQVIKGSIALIKHTDDGETKLETPEAGAEFSVYLKSSGSYDAAKDSERDTLICDENGFAQTKQLPYGIYTVHQVSGWEGRELLADFDVYIAKDGQVYRYLANNANFESYIKVIKVDAETGKTIPYAGAGFQIYRPDGSKVEMTFTYPTPTTIDTFYTNDEGYLVTPEKLEYGSGYSLVEVSAPYGYVLNSDPVTFVAADEYLSGNVRRKLRMAKALYEVLPAEKKPLIAKNIEALEAVQPVDLTAAEIGVRIGANWIPMDIYQKFMVETFDTSVYARSRIKILRSEATGQWGITEKNTDRSNIKVTTTYGTKRMNAYQILEQTLNQRDVRVFDYVEDENGNKKPVLNKKETAIAQDRQELIKQKFSEWIWKDIDRRERLCGIYNETFNSIRPREYDGSHIRFSGMNPEITLRPHQVNAIAHIMYGGNTLLAHEVGAGKTFEMVAAAMEMKRLGLCTKSLIVVPNHITEQWAAEWLQLYPSANILVATKKDFETRNRKKFCARIATGDYDAVIIGHSQFEKIPMSAERQAAILQQQIDEIMFGIEEAKSAKAERYTVKQLERTRKSLEAKLDRLNDQSRKDDLVTFEELGVDRIFVDESHYFKNLFLATKMRNVGGIAQTEAQKSSDLFMKCRYLDEITGNRGVIFATGTPISNSMVVRP